MRKPLESIFGRGSGMLLTETKAGPVRSCGAFLCLWLLLAACLPVSTATAAESKTGSGTHKPRSPADETVLAGHLKSAFEEGAVVSPERLLEAQRHLALARRADPGDWRIDYAHGLVLVKQSQMKPAIAKFETARSHDGGRHWPAWQATIWAQLVDKQYEARLKKLAEYAAAVQAAERPDEVSDVQRDAARWIGQLIGALSLCADSQRQHDSAEGQGKGASRWKVSMVDFGPSINYGGSPAAARSPTFVACGMRIAGSSMALVSGLVFGRWIWQAIMKRNVSPMGGLT